MKKLLTAAFALLLTAGLMFAQDTGGDKARKTTTTRTAASGKKATKVRKSAHKGGKKVTPALNPQPLPPKIAPPTTTNPQ